MISTVEEIQAELVESDTLQANTPFVAFAVRVDENYDACHAGLIISCDDGDFLFHFDGAVKLESIPLGEWYFHKNTSLIEERYVTAFLALCKDIRDNSNPKFGYFVQDSLYRDGKFFSNSQLDEYLTCVGFCINVVQTYLTPKKPLIVFEDWNADEVPPGWFGRFVEREFPDMKDEALEKYADHLRRIDPTHYICFGYFNEIPIRKDNVDKIYKPMIEALYQRVPKGA